MKVNPAALRTIRERSGYSIRKLGDLSGVSRTTISAIEQGRREPSPATVVALARSLQVPLAALLAEGEEQAS